MCNKIVVHLVGDLLGDLVVHVQNLVGDLMGHGNGPCAKLNGHGNGLSCLDARIGFLPY